MTVNWWLLAIYLYAGPLGILAVGLVMGWLLVRDAQAAARRGQGLFADAGDKELP